ncbi:hypothetical protein [Parasedimentitalea huanghaiensis]|uniref:Uncharacterized protein n=1 Tax=Parasedimentitalea huanghaiensis TaxID=2682100 RepID=A0A6L6WGT4_9RHOB|nr:hypothetical protein [Zongyanglinia huanghaiensis]MVO15785.1 hypothetical protein [Zongyanglinia huanghaiensis]
MDLAKIESPENLVEWVNELPEKIHKPFSMVLGGRTAQRVLANAFFAIDERNGGSPPKLFALRCAVITQAVQFGLDQALILASKETQSRLIPSNSAPDEVYHYTLKIIINLGGGC